MVWEIVLRSGGLRSPMPVINRAMSLRVWFGNLSIARIASSAHAVFSLKRKITLGSPRLALKVGR